MAWSDYTSRCCYEEFDNAYRGGAESEEDFAMECVEEQGLLSNVPEPLRNYFDYEAYARDLFSCDYIFHDGFVFSNR